MRGFLKVTFRKETVVDGIAKVVIGFEHRWSCIVLKSSILGSKAGIDYVIDCNFFPPNKPTIYNDREYFNVKITEIHELIRPVIDQRFIDLPDIEDEVPAVDEKATNRVLKV